MEDLRRYPLGVLIAQRDLALMKLMKKEPEQYGEIDRLYGESDFRRAVALPLISLSILLSLEFQNILPAFVGTYLTLFLIMDGAVQRRQANKRLANALYLDHTSIPSVDAAVEDFKREVYKDSGNWLEDHLRNEGFTDEADALSRETAGQSARR